MEIEHYGKYILKMVIWITRLDKVKRAQIL